MNHNDYSAGAVDRVIDTTSSGRAHHIDDLVRLFNHCFKHSENTILVPGAEEPLYLPAKKGQSYHELHSRADYFASGLHEIAHWCIAGKARRQQEDFGYWYQPDGRSPEQQSMFERVEAKPQALEWILSNACGFTFQVSVDNLNADDMEPGDAFLENILAACHGYLERGLPPRAGRFAALLSEVYSSGTGYLNADVYSMKILRNV